MDRLLRTARTLRRGRGREKAGPLPTLWLVTDPQRLPDPAAAARRLPPGSGVIYRAFGAADAPLVARRLAEVARDRRLVLLIGKDEALAAACGAAGVHLPERDIAALPRLRARHPGWRFTVAAHSARALARAARAGADAALLSPAFASRSPSAGAPLGPVRFAALARRARLPVIALAGITAKTAPRLTDAAAYGLAAVEGLGGA